MAKGDNWTKDDPHDEKHRAAENIRKVKARHKGLREVWIKHPTIPKTWIVKHVKH